MREALAVQFSLFYQPPSFPRLDRLPYAARPYVSLECIEDRMAEGSTAKVKGVKLNPLQTKVHKLGMGAPNRVRRHRLLS